MTLADRINAKSLSTSSKLADKSAEPAAEEAVPIEIGRVRMMPDMKGTDSMDRIDS